MSVSLKIHSMCIYNLVNGIWL